MPTYVKIFSRNVSVTTSGSTATTTAATKGDRDPERSAAHHTFSRPERAEQPLRPHEQHAEQHDERDGVLVERVDVAGGQDSRAGRG